MEASSHYPCRFTLMPYQMLDSEVFGSEPQTGVRLKVLRHRTHMHVMPVIFLLISAILDSLVVCDVGRLQYMPRIRPDLFP